MKRWRRRDWGLWTGTALLCAIAVGIWTRIFSIQDETRQIEDQTTAVHQRIKSLFETAPPPTIDSLKSLRARLSLLEAQVNASMRELRKRTRDGSARHNSPGDGVSVYFYLVEQIDALHAKAEDQGIFIHDHARRFGFDALIDRGNDPDPARAAMIVRDAAFVTSAMHHLFESNPIEITRISRWDTEESRDASSQVIDRRSTTDGFLPVANLAHPELIETRTFAVEFSGQTSVLRKFLQKITNSTDGLLVRRLEVWPMEDPNSAKPLSDRRAFALFDAGSAGTESHGMAVIVPQNQSNFRVVLNGYTIAAERSKTKAMTSLHP